MTVADIFEEIYIKECKKTNFKFKTILNDNRFNGHNLQILPSGSGMLLSDFLKNEAKFDINISFSDNSKLKITDHNHTKESLN